MTPSDRGVLLDILGNRIWYSDTGAESRVPLLLLHGGPGAPHDYLEPLASELSQRHRVIMYDQLGCGISDKPQDRSLWSLDHYLAELRALIELLELKEFVVMGWHARFGICCNEAGRT